MQLVDEVVVGSGKRYTPEPTGMPQKYKRCGGVGMVVVVIVVVVVVGNCNVTHALRDRQISGQRPYPFHP